MLTIHSAPDQITAMINVDFENSITAGEVEQIVQALETEAHARWPELLRLFIRPMAGAAAERERAEP